MNRLRTMPALLALVVQTACINSENGEHQSSPVATSQAMMQRDAESLAPGDQDYPLINPAPRQRVQFGAVMPSTLTSELHLIYVVDSTQDKNHPFIFRAPPGCRWTQERQFRVVVQLKLERSGNRYEGSFSPDMFLPGACGWHLYDLVSSISNSPVIYFERSLSKSARPVPNLDLTVDQRHLWCVRRKEDAVWPTAPRQDVNCVPLDMIGFWTKVPTGFRDSVPVAERFAGSHVITQYLSFLTVEFHDADAAISDHRSGQRSASP